jgi:hypothetical protein
MVIDMGKATELKTTTALVKDILEHEPEARNSDDYLYLKVCQRINGICLNLPFHQIMLNRSKYGFPIYESVRRSRQKLQARFPELAGDADVEAQRELNEAVFREYARS